MPLTSIYPQLLKAREEGYAVPLFDTFDSVATDGMLAAVAEAKAPVILALYASTFEQPNAKAMAAYIRARLDELPTPASLMLDHGASFEMCMRAIHAGCTDVMFDGSKTPLEDNIAQTKAVVRAAHAVGVKVEAELGHVGLGSEYQEYGGQRKGFTDPATAERFVAETGVDFLAVAIGTAHGVYVGEPQIDLELLADLRRRLPVPLVMHGGSGLSEDQFRGAIRAGISKINVATDLVLTGGRKMNERSSQGKAGYFDLTQTAAASFHERSRYYLDLFGASGKG